MAKSYLSPTTTRLSPQFGKSDRGAASRKCLSNCLDKSIAAQSAKLKSLALIPEVNPSVWEGAYGCSGEQVSESKRIHQTVRT